MSAGREFAKLRLVASTCQNPDHPDGKPREYLGYPSTVQACCKKCRNRVDYLIRTGKFIMNLTYFLMCEDVLIATPDCFASSERTQDINFFDLAESHALQTKARMASSVFIEPLVSYATPSVGNELHKNVACYLSAFKQDPSKQKEAFDYLMTNPVIRILWLCD